MYPTPLQTGSGQRSASHAIDHGHDQTKNVESGCCNAEKKHQHTPGMVTPPQPRMPYHTPEHLQLLPTEPIRCGTLAPRAHRYNMNKYAGRTTRSFRRMRIRILEMSDICWLCGHAGADTVDHIIPLSVDPTRAEDPTNLLPAHRSCNSSRGNKLPQAKRLNTSRNW